MVKNEKGGNKSKKLGRKHINDSNAKSQQDINVRYATEEGEMYAVVSKVYGNNMCLVECNDGVSRNCIIRKKFSGRRKKDNILTQGVWVLVGERDWEILIAGKKPRCDLLEVYSNEEKHKLENSNGVDVRRLSKLTFDKDKGDGDSSCDFISSETSSYQKIISESGEEGKSSSNQIFNFDDI